MEVPVLGEASFTLHSPPSCRYRPRAGTQASREKEKYPRIWGLWSAAHGLLSYTWGFLRIGYRTRASILGKSCFRPEGTQFCMVVSNGTLSGRLH